ncbi:MAG: Ig-like domain-containing protein [Bacteroidaceae bacterium]|nr:Ig-like domain-containing protein [Bacteroidaceae bacterium]
MISRLRFENINFAHANMRNSVNLIKCICPHYSFSIFLLCLFLFMGISVFAQQTASRYVGESATFSAPNPPVSKAAIYQTAWSSSHKSVKVEKYMGLGCKATITEYFTDRAEIRCDYYYYWYDNYGYQHTNHATTYCYLTCKAVECRLSTYSMTLSPGESKQISYTLSPSISPTPTVRFFSNNYLVADVSNNGVVMAKGPGSCTITVNNSAGPDATCKVVVRDINPTSIYLSSPGRIKINQTVKLTPELSPSNASTTFSWSSSNSGIASVDNYGNVTGKAEGSARITVRTANNLSASCDVEVYKPVPSQIKLNKTSLRMAVGASESLTYDVTPSDAIYTVSWESDAPQIASVSSTGRVEAKNPGTARITVTTDNRKSSVCQVTVAPEPSSISVSPKELELVVGRTKKLSYSLSPSDALTRSVAWSSSEPSVASIDQNGAVTARKPGQAVLTATTANGISASCSLTVPIPLFQLFLWTKDGLKTGYLSTDEPEFSMVDDVVRFRTKQLTLDIQQEDFDKFTLEQVLPEHPKEIALPEEMKLGLGQSKQLSYALTPNDAEAKVTWLNDNPEVVDVSKSGQVSGLKVGTARIMAQTSNGLRAECRVTVPEPHHCFYVWLRSGAVHKFELEEKPQVTFGQEHFTLTSAKTTVTYDAANVLRFTLQDAAVEDIPTDIIEPETPRTNASYQSGELTIQSEKPFAAVRIYDVSGRIVETLQTNAQGSLTVSLSSYSTGIYIIKSEQTTLKIQKR